MKSITTQPPIIFGGIYVAPPYVRRVWFEAVSQPEAEAFCEQCGIGFLGQMEAPQGNPLAEAYDAKTACRLLGGISLSTLYRLLGQRKVSRASGTRRLLITRESIEQGGWRK